MSKTPSSRAQDTHRFQLPPNTIERAKLSRQGGRRTAVHGSREARQVDLPFQVIKAERNLGLATAVSLAWKRSNARMLATLNDDTEAHAAWLRVALGSPSPTPRAKVEA